MALFCVAVRKNIFSLEVFLFFALCRFFRVRFHQLIFYNCFSSYLCILDVILLIIIFLYCFCSLLILSLIPCIDTSTPSSKLANPLDTFSLFISSLRYKALRIVANFLILWSFSLSSFIVLFKNDPEYLSSGTAKVFIPLMRFILQCLVL